MCQTKRLWKISQPDVEVKGNVRFDLEFVLLCGLKNAVVCSIIVLEQFAVQKPEKKGDGGLHLKIKSHRLVLGEESVFLEMRKKHQ